MALEQEAYRSRGRGGEEGKEDQQPLADHEHKETSRIHKHPHCSFQRELLIQRDHPGLLFTVYTTEDFHFLGL